MRRIAELGHISDEELASVYAASDVLAQPSLAEGFGLPVIEAMAAGLPVVASDGGALPEVTAGAAITVPLDSTDFPKALADGILLAAASQTRLRQLGLKRSADFMASRIVPQLLEAYETAASSSRRRGSSTPG